MSYWTYISGVITVHVHGNTQPQKRYILDTVLEHLPVVSGSEFNMKTHVVQAHGHNESCSHNEFGESAYYRQDGDCRGWMELQSDYFIVVEAKLRDRMFDETKVELNKWLCRLAKRLWVRDILIRIKGQDRELLITDAKPYEDMMEPFSRNEESDGEPAWTEYLLWDRAKDSWYPMMLAYKYFCDPENDKEVERRMEYRKR